MSGYQVPLFGTGPGPHSESEEREAPRLVETFPFRRRKSPRRRGQVAILVGQCERCGADFQRMQLGRPRRFCNACRGRGSS